MATPANTATATTSTDTPDTDVTVARARPVMACWRRASLTIDGVVDQPERDGQDDEPGPAPGEGAGGQEHAGRGDHQTDRARLQPRRAAHQRRPDQLTDEHGGDEHRGERRRLPCSTATSGRYSSPRSCRR